MKERMDRKKQSVVGGKQRFGGMKEGVVGRK